MWADRWTAGVELARALQGRVAPTAVVVGIARGGVVVAAAVAETLGLPLGAIIAKKVTPPEQPEFALGAVAGGGEPVMGAWAQRWSEPVRQAAIATARAQAQQLTEQLGGLPPVAGRQVILVDDGIATGMTVLAALRALRAAGAQAVIVGAPVASAEASAMLGREADDMVVLMMPEPFWAVGAYYRDFRATETDEVRAWLRRVNRGAESA